MRYEIIPIAEEGSAPYARLCVYLWDHTPEIPIEARPLILICPGGGYHKTSDREAEAVALRFMAMGCHTAVLRYSVSPARCPVALHELARAVTLLRAHTEDWHIDRYKLVVMGFSAGGHLAASYGVFWNRPELSAAMGCDKKLLKPNGLILGYPVITAEKKFCHKGSFDHLLGSKAEAEQRDALSLEKQVGNQVPRTFIWNTAQDDAVHPMNSLLFAQALLLNHVPVEYHLYEKGGHGLSLANEQTNDLQGQRFQAECQNWVTLAETWLKGL
ncbi:MAG: alpha/beta hydrolase [Oscillospiraceae bacterium]|nr:alpha/beta hydrolase [Oscillospiraceae bacterium]